MVENKDRETLLRSYIYDACDDEVAMNNYMACHLVTTTQRTQVQHTLCFYDFRIFLSKSFNTRRNMNPLIMFEVFNDTSFGRLTNLVSRGRLYHPDDTIYLARLKLDKDEHDSISDCPEPNTSDLENPPPSKPEYPATPVMDWTENDPQNPRNWSFGKKIFVTFQICLLTTAVYMGSAIYTAGIVDVQRDFNVSQMSALVGLTLVLGYALGPMVWVSECLCFGVFLSC